MMELQQIAERCQQGDREAFALLYTAMREPLRTLCLSFVKNEAVADDLLHDAFLLIFSKFGELKDTSCTEAWMKTVTRRVALLYLRQQHQQVPLSASPELTTFAVENNAEPSLVLQDILAAVDDLPEGYRRVFRMSVFEGMSHQEIANLLHIEPHSSSSQLFHAKVLLRRWLRPLALLLLAVALPLSVYIWKQNDEKEISKTVETDKQKLATTEKTNQECLAKQETTLRPKVEELLAEADTATNVAPTVSQDTTKAVPIPQHERPRRQVSTAESPREVPPADMQRRTPTATADGWNLALAYSGIRNSKDMQLPYANAETNPAVYDSIAHHHMPLTIGLMLNRKLDSHWQLGIGLRYQRMTSDMLSGNTYISLSQHQKVQYLAIPVSVSWYYPLGRRFSTYLSASAAVNLPLRSTLESVYLMNGKEIDPTTERLHPDVQWSMGLGLGLQYDLTPNIGFFVEPSLQYYFKRSSDVKTWNTEHPLSFSLPLGLRITF
jgi:RNA polymerase sigma-70 factor (ECF subfamily)